MHFITELGKEHRSAIIKEGTANAFVEDPVLSKHLWDRFQSMHIHSLSCCVAIQPTEREHIVLFDNCVGEIADSGDSNAPLHT